MEGKTTRVRAGISNSEGAKVQERRSLKIKGKYRVVFAKSAIS